MSGSGQGGGAEPAALAWSDLEVLLAVCRAGSLSGAARALAVNHSTVFRRVNSIEERTRVRFFERMPDGYKMTDAGRMALAHAERVEAEVKALSRGVLGQDLRLEGKVLVTAPEGFVSGMGPAIVARFLQKYPDISVELASGYGAADLARREADLAIRATRSPPETSVGRAVCDFRFACFASPAYHDRHRDVPLAEQSWCSIAGYLHWLVPLVFKKLAQAEERQVFSSTSTFSVMGAVAEGLGVAVMPCYVGDADERVVRVTPPFEALTLKLWLLMHQDLRHTARVKALSAFVYEELTTRRALFDGSGGQNAP